MILLLASIIKFCQKCDALITFKGGNHKYCDTCKDKIRKETKKLWEDQYRKTNTHFCLNCGKTIHNYKGRNHKYCKVCSINIELEKSRLRNYTYYRNWNDVWISDLGSSWLSEHPRNSFEDNDFKEEFNTVRRELKRLRLKN